MFSGAELDNYLNSVPCCLSCSFILTFSNNDFQQTFNQFSQCLGKPHMSQFSCPFWFINVQCLHDQPAPLGEWDISTMSTSPDPRGSGEGAGEEIF